MERSSANKVLMNGKALHNSSVKIGITESLKPMVFIIAFSGADGLKYKLDLLVLIPENIQVDLDSLHSRALFVVKSLKVNKIIEKSTEIISRSSRKNSLLFSRIKVKLKFFVVIQVTRCISENKQINKKIVLMPIWLDKNKDIIGYSQIISIKFY